MRPILLSALAGALVLLALPAGAQIYRWVDERGVVNYASRPPADGVRAVRVDQAESRISVIPMAPRARDPVPPLSSAVAPGFPGAVDQATVATLASSMSAAGRRERCFAERRVDCTNPTAATYDFALAYSPAPATLGFAP